MFNRFQLGHKPALIVTVSSADGGAYPVAELRMSSYKNNRICYLPEHVILRNVERILNDDAKDNRFLESVGRFPEIEEDEEPLYFLCNEYPV